MKEYVTSAVAVCAICAIASALAPDTKMTRQVNFLLSLAVMASLVTPILSSVPYVEEMGRELLYQVCEEYSSDGSANSYLDGVTQNAVNEGVRRSLCKELGIREECGVVECQFTVVGDDVIFEKVFVSLSGEGIFADISAIKRYIRKNLCEHCEVRMLEK